MYATKQTRTAGRAGLSFALRVMHDVAKRRPAPSKRKKPVYLEAEVHVPTGRAQGTRRRRSFFFRTI